jgi:putative membrane-bound dehydrogenase-like protein
MTIRLGLRNSGWLKVLGLSVAWFFPVAICAQNRNNKTPDVPEDLAPKIEVLQAGVRLTLLAAHPELVTPTGIDTDDLGQIWLVACHTHFRPDEYTGPEHDEVLVFDKSGKNRRVFYNSTDATMHIELGPDGWVYLAERDRILRVKDSNGDGIGDFEENLLTLDTVADYPHNGLSGMAWHPDGGLIFSLGENFAKDWTLTSNNGVKLRGRGEGGIFRCAADGSKLRRIAKGFWNPFGLMVRNDGEMFAVENDPGSRPPCRLLNIMEGADYGYQRAYGNDAVHPFVAWNGELRGTLGMVHPTGEGPCSLVELGGGVLVPSWSNHGIDYFPLSRKGAGYTSERIEILRGSDHFRPVCIVSGSDGAFYLTDWVFSSYQLHGRGRLWKLEIDLPAATWVQRDRAPMNEETRLAQDLRSGKTQSTMPKLFQYARSRDTYISDAALSELARFSRKWTPETLLSMTTEDRLWALVALRRNDLTDDRWISVLRDDPAVEIQFERLRWMADGVLTKFLPEVEQLLVKPELDFRLFEAGLATFNTLRGKPEAGVTDVPLLLHRLNDVETPASIKKYVLRLLPAPDKRLSISLLRELFALKDELLSLEVIHRLSMIASADACNLLAEIASDNACESQIRADAVAALAVSISPEHQQLLINLASHPLETIRNEAIRSLRARPLAEEEKAKLKLVSSKHSDAVTLVDAVLEPISIHRDRPLPNENDVWLKRLAAIPGKPDVDAGRRIFFHAKIGNCSSCHRYDGRGNVVGPDLGFVSSQGKPEMILQSILEPNREVAPQFYATILELDNGNFFTGILLRSSSTEVYRDNQGLERVFKKDDIIQRKEVKTSLMPTGLVEQLTDQELRDLIAFLSLPANSRH